MYCPKCGTLNNDGTNFCANCGEKLVDNVGNSGNKRAEADYYIKVLPDLIRPLKAIVDYDFKICELNNDIETIKKKKSYQVIIILEAVLMVISIGPSLGGASSGDMGLFYSFLTIMSVLNIFASPALIIFIIMSIVEKKKIKKIMCHINEAENNRDGIIDSIKNDIVILPPNYRYYFAANSFYTSFINFKADTIKEAVLICDTEIDRIRKDNYLERQYNLLRIMSDVNMIKWYSEFTALNSL